MEVVVQTLQQQFHDVEKSRPRVDLPVWPGKVVGSLSRTETYQDVGLTSPWSTAMSWCTHFFMNANTISDVGRCSTDRRLGRSSFAFAPQNLAELYAIVTDSRRVSISRQPSDALEAIERLLAMPGMRLLPTPSDVVCRWIALARRHPVTRGRVFDLQLIATMLGNDVRKIYTFDRSDFESFDEIEVLVP